MVAIITCYDFYQEASIAVCVCGTFASSFAKFIRQIHTYVLRAESNGY